MNKFLLFTTGGGSTDPMGYSSDEAAIYNSNDLKSIKPGSKSTVKIIFQSQTTKDTVTLTVLGGYISDVMKSITKAISTGLDPIVRIADVDSDYFVSPNISGVSISSSLIGGTSTKYLYFRTEATDANDDAAGDSALFPASSLMGMQPTSDTALTLYFKSMLRGPGNEGAGDALANLDNNDSVIVTISANTHLVAMQTITEAINDESLSSTLIIANDDSGGTEYLAGSGISACGTISVAVAYAN